jgi:peroxiredoxin
MAIALLGAPAAGDPLTSAQRQALNLGSYRPGTKPPEFTGRTLEDQTVSLAGLRGKVVILNFWASWCLECRPEMPALENLHRKYASRGLAVLGVNAREGREAAGRFARELGLTFPLVLDFEGAVSAQYGVVGLPTTFLIGRDGRAVALAIGPRDWGGPAAEGIIRSLLLDPPAAHAPR